MVQVTVEQAVSDFGKLLEEVGRGEEFVIVQGKRFWHDFLPPCRLASREARLASLLISLKISTHLWKILRIISNALAAIQNPQNRIFLSLVSAGK